MAPEEKPTLLDMAKDLIVSTTKHALSGFKKSEDMSQERMKICESCPFYVADQKRCARCGCYMPIKSAWKTAKCPEGKW